MGRIGGRIYGIPLERPLPGSTLWINQDMFAGAGMKEGWTAEDFTAVARRGTRGKTYMLGAAYSVGGEPGGIVAARRSFGYTVLKQAKKERVELLLRILDYLAAPFGSEEWELVHYGVEGVHFTRAKDGSPEPTELGEIENNTNLPLKYLAEGPQVLFVPGMPDAVRALHAWQRKVVPHAIRDASFGLQSATNNSQGATLKAFLDDTITGIIAGRLPLSEWDAAVKKWRSRGGDRMAEEYAKDYAANT